MKKIIYYLGILVFAMACSNSSTSPEPEANFFLANNGVTVKCPDAEIGDTETVNGITYTKRSKSQITSSNASATCTSGIQNMEELFSQSAFNGDISTWDVSSVTNMTRMFYNSNFDQPIGNWDVSNVTDMVEMFWNSNFNQPLANWDVSSVIDMTQMFYNSNFNKPIGNWDVSNVGLMREMFWNSNFNQPINSWCVSNIASEPEKFSTGSPLTEENKPVWGSCPE